MNTNGVANGCFGRFGRGGVDYCSMAPSEIKKLPGIQFIENTKRYLVLNTPNQLR